MEPKNPTVAFLKERVGKVDVGMPTMSRSARPGAETVCKLETSCDRYPDTILLLLPLSSLPLMRGRVFYLGFVNEGAMIPFRSEACPHLNYDVTGRIRECAPFVEG